MGEKAAITIKTKWRRPGTNRPTVPSPTVIPVPVNPNIDVLINDPSTPELKTSVSVPLMPLPVGVIDYRGSGYDRGSKEGQSANCYVTIANILNYYNSKTDSPLSRWIATKNLIVAPRLGVGLNAYYNRRTLSFFYANYPQLTKTVFASDSTDIVAHELGHAILDSYRPDMWNAASVEIAAFHEAFGDFTAIIHLMQYDEALNFALIQTGGDLRQASVISRLAEEFGQTVYRMVPVGRNPDYLRCAVNNFKYVNPSTLPPEVSSNDQMSRNVHDFARIFLGALWDILMLIFDDKKTSLEPIAALRESRDIISRYMLKAIQNAPLNVRFYESMAKTLLWADVTLGNRKYHDQMQEIFFNREILIPQLGIQSVEKCRHKIVKKKEKMFVRMNEIMFSALSGRNPLMDVKVEIPCESVKLYDNNGNFYDMCRCSDHESYHSAADMLHMLHVTNSVSKSRDTPFEVKNGVLCRTHMSCGCGEVCHGLL